MENYYSVIISYKELRIEEKRKGIEWIKWCWDNGIEFSWTIDEKRSQLDLNEAYMNYVYIIRFDSEEDKLLFILNWV